MINESNELDVMALLRALEAGEISEAELAALAEQTGQGITFIRGGAE